MSAVVNSQGPATKDEEADLRRVVGKRVRTERVWQELSQEQLATAAGVTRNFVSSIERGAQGLDAYRLGRLADALGVTLVDLLSTKGRTA